MVNVKANPYYPIKTNIHKSRNGQIFNSNTGNNKVAGTGLDNSLIPSSYSNV